MTERITYNKILDIAQEAASIGYYEYNIKNGQLKLTEHFKSSVLPINEDDNFLDYVHPYHQELLKSKFKEFIKSDKTKFKIKYDVINPKTNEIMTLEDVAHIERDSNGRALKIFGFKKDVTNLEKIVNENQETIKVLTNQNEKLNDLAYMLAHNIKSPITNLKLIFNLLDSNSLTDKELDEYMGEMRLVVNDLLDTLTELNDSLVVNTLDINFETINIKNFINQIINSNFRTRLNKINASVIINSDVETFKYSKLYLKSYLINIISNAIKYASPERTLNLRIIIKIIDEKINIFIQDNGLGIDLEKYGDKLFKLKETFHSNKNGKGIGLFIVYNQLQSLNGFIECNSTVNKGTTFRMVL